MNIKYIENLIQARESLKVWLSNVEQLHFGNQMFAKANDLDRKNTDFYEWYNGEGQTFSSFETFQVLDSFYNVMYDNFLEYIALREMPLKKSLFSNEKEKRQQKLNDIFYDLKQNARKLIKSVDIFEEKLKNSPLFEGHQFESNSLVNDFDFSDISLEVKEDSISLNTTESFEIELPQLDDFELETFEKNDFEFEQTNNSKEEKIDLKEEIKNEILPKTDSFDFEKRLQEEVAKLKKQLEEEFEQKLKQNQLSKEQESTQILNKEREEIDSSVKEEIKKEETKIDVSEEIRRFLS